MLKIFLAELVGTLLLILLGNGSVANVLLKGSKGEKGGWIVIAFGWGLAVTVAVYVCGWVSGGHINPAVTLSLAAIGNTPWSEVPAYILGQFIGAFIGSLLVYLTYYDHYCREKNPEIIQLTFCTKPVIENRKINFSTEVIATFVLIAAILGIIDKHEELSQGMAPYMFGMAVTAIGLSLGGPTGYAINPARDLAPRLAHSMILRTFRKSHWEYAWIPLIGPIIGGMIAAFGYHTLFN